MAATLKGKHSGLAPEVSAPVRQPANSPAAKNSKPSAATSPPQAIGNQTMQRLLRSILQGGGEPLDAALRSFYEARFRQSLDRVRVHTESQAADLAGSLDARAFAVGNDIVF